MNSLLEQYVKEVSKGLEDLTEARRTEELTEVRQHLEASVKAYKALGLEEAAAMEETVHQFGAARKVSGGLRRAYWREKFFVSDSLWGAALIAVCASLVLGHVSTQFLQVFTLGLGWRGESSAHFSVYLIIFIVQTANFAAGYIAGRVAPRRGVLGTIVGKSLFAAYGSLLFLLTWGLANYHQTKLSLAGTSPSNILAQTISGDLFAIPLCALGAYLGSRYSSARITRA